MAADISTNRTSIDRTGAAGAGAHSARAPAKGGGRIWVAAFLIGLVIPLFVFLGPLRLSAYRVVLLVLFFPALYLLFSGRAGRIRLPDICVILICLWSSLSIIVVHGLAPMVETIGILWVETLGAYLVGRCFIRTPEAFFAAVRLMAVIAVLILPFALFELWTGRNLYLQIFDAIGPVYGENFQEGRLGLDRVQGPFAHPIHFGVFFGGLVGLAYYVLGYGKSWLGRVRRAGLMVFLCFAALSSGPLAAAVAQIYFLLWDGVFKRVISRWKILAGLSLLAYVVVDILSNRTPFEVFISYFAFNAETAYNRIRIWDYGTQNIFANPVFGLGFGDWARPYWMSDSVDMFWILPAMRHGVLVWILYLTLFFSIFIGVIRARGFGDRMQWYRTGYLCSMTGLFMAGWTVHYWDALLSYFMFLLASGVWMLDWQDNARPDIPQPLPQNGVAYTRFPPGRGKT